jgi:hypothetical protein
MDVYGEAETQDRQVYHLPKRESNEAGPQTKSFEPVFVGHPKIWTFAAGHWAVSIRSLIWACLCHSTVCLLGFCQRQW